MIDLHCHILPDIDDGPDDIGEALAMARLAEADGVQQIAATPHFTDDYWPEPEAVRARLEGLRRRLAEEGRRVQVLPGGEVFLEADVPARAAAGMLPTLNGGPYVLVELPMYSPSLPNHAELVLTQLQAFGLRPIIAHPERCTALRHDPGLLETLVRRGLLAQLNAGSLSGAYGLEVRRAARELLRRRLVHIIASDGHDTGKHHASLARAAQEAAGVVGREEALAMASTVPAAILAGQRVAVPEPVAPAGRGWSFWSRRREG